MTQKRFPRLRRLCNALPETKYDERLHSLSMLQQLLAFAVTAAVVITVPPHLVESQAAVTPVAVALAFGTFHGVTHLFVWYKER